MLSNEELRTQVDELEEDFKFFNDQIRSMEDIIGTLKQRREDAWPRFFELLTEAKRRGLYATEKNNGND